METINAKITSTNLGIGESNRGFFSCWLFFEFDSGGQGYGGRAFCEYIPKLDKRIGTAYGAQCIMDILNTLGVDSWEDLPGTYCRVKREDGYSGMILEIGNITKNKWFSFDKELNNE